MPPRLKPRPGRSSAIQESTKINPASPRVPAKQVNGPDRIGAVYKQHMRLARRTLHRCNPTIWIVGVLKSGYFVAESFNLFNQLGFGFPLIIRRTFGFVVFCH